jgi:hypothetical protein
MTVGVIESFTRWPEILTNVLDGAAFLMVTIDLYGRQRLENLAAKMKECSFRRWTHSDIGSFIGASGESALSSAWYGYFFYCQSRHTRLACLDQSRAVGCRKCVVRHCRTIEPNGLFGMAAV